MLPHPPLNTQAAQHIHILVIEDNRADARLIELRLQEASPGLCRVEHAGTLAEGLCQCDEERFSVVLLDLGLPDSIGLVGLRELRNRHPDLPILVVTGLEDEQTALAALREGAQDYVIKGQFDGGWLLRAVRYAVERQRLLTQLQEALAKVDTLSGLLPLCAGCKKIRDAAGAWQALDRYVQDHSRAEFSHGLCPDCLERLYPQGINGELPE